MIGKKFIFGLGCAAMLAMFASPASATILSDWGLGSAVYTNGAYGNWNIDTPRTETGYNNGIAWAEGNDTVPDNPVYGPGPSGGEPYDIEFLAWRRTDTTFQVMGITSVDPFTGTAEGFRLGDVFVNVDGAATGYEGYDLALSMGDWTTVRGEDNLHPGDGLYNHSSAVGVYAIGDVDDVHGISGNDGYGTFPGITALADPFAIRDGSRQVAGAQLTIEQIQDDHGQPNWALQWTIDLPTFRALLPTVDSQPYFGDMVMHWTVECGNDWIDTDPIGPENSTIPEPATLSLLGLGLATIGFTRRRRRKV